MKKRYRLMLLVLVVVLACSGCGLEKNSGDWGVDFNMHREPVGSEDAGQSNGDSEKDGQSNDGQEAEEPYVLTFEATTVDGETMTSDCFADSKLTMLNIWGTFCSPCIEEMPDLGEIAGAYDKAEFQLIGIVSDVYDNATDKELAEAKRLITETGANYPHLLVSDSLYQNLVGATTAVPTTFFVNQKGEVLGYLVGAMSKENWEEIISGLLAEIS